MTGWERVEEIAAAVGEGDRTAAAVEAQAPLEPAAAEDNLSSPASLISQPGWPELADEALHSLAGDFVRLLDPHTEADPVAVLAQFLAAFGSMVGRGPHFRAEADKHAGNLFAVLVGETAKGRKGSSAGHVLELARAVAPEWRERRVVHGLSSGEGLIWAVRDPIYKTKASKTAEQPKDVCVDSGEEDKRLLVLEAEFASTLRVLGRDGSTLSPVIRCAWDRGDLQSLTKNSPARASGALVSIVGHITRQELLRHLSDTEAASGFGNRFLWLMVRRSKVLPEGGQFHAVDRGPIIRRLREAVEFSGRLGDTELERDSEAREAWKAVYPELSEGKPGLLGAMIARAEAQTMRLALLYALLDQSREIRAEHLAAALAVWEYAEASARYIFGDTLGDPTADRILRALRYEDKPLARTDLHRLFSRNRSAADLDRALGDLLERGLVSTEKVAGPEGGRPAELWSAI